MMRICLPLTAVAVLLSGCADRSPPVAAAPVPPPVAAAPAPRPLPPGGASTTFVAPAVLADGSYDTPNRALTLAATTWHLRAALNVAALRCNDEGLIAAYNLFVRTHAKALGAAHATATREAGGQAVFDTAQTKLYNYLALPPVQAAFCAAATTIADEAGRTPSSDFARFATLSLPVLDAPFTNFFRDYRRYRADLAAWQAGAATTQVAAGPTVAPAPRLSYDTAVFMAEGPPQGRSRGVAVAAR